MSQQTKGGGGLLGRLWRWLTTRRNPLHRPSQPGTGTYREIAASQDATDLPHNPSLAVLPVGIDHDPRRIQPGWRTGAKAAPAEPPPALPDVAELDQPSGLILTDPATGTAHIDVFGGSFRADPLLPKHLSLDLRDLTGEDD